MQSRKSILFLFHIIVRKIVQNIIVEIFFSRFNFHNKWLANIFILNQAFAILFHCVLFLSVQTILFFRKRWDWGIYYCKVYANIVVTNQISVFMSVAVIAVNSNLMITNPLKPKILSSVRNQIIITLLIRIYGFIITLPQTTGVSFYLVFTQHKWFKL